MSSLVCITCNNPIEAQWYFCPNCGAQLKEKEKIIVITPGKQAMIYAVSFFLAPLGLGWGLRYIRNNDPKVRMVGWIAIILTIISLLLVAVVFQRFMNAYTEILNGLGTGSLPSGYGF